MQIEPELSPLFRNSAIRHYEIREALQSDELSISYKAWDTKRTRLVIIKEYAPKAFVFREQNTNNVCLLKNKTEAYSKGLKAFQEQAKTLASFNHPNIIKVSEPFQLNNTAYLCMPFEQGQSLEQLLLNSDDKLPNNELKSIFMAMLNALQYIHAHNEYHKNITLNAIFLRKNGGPLLINFADAQPGNNAYDNQLIEAEAVNDTLDYYLPSDDLYALGAAMYYYISGQQPIDVLSRLDAINKEGVDPLLPASTVGFEQYSINLLYLIDWLLSPSQINRPQHASLVLAQLESGQLAVPHTLFQSNTQTGSSASVSKPNFSSDKSLVLHTDVENNKIANFSYYQPEITQHSPVTVKKPYVIIGLFIILFALIGTSQIENLQKLFTNEPSDIIEVARQETSPVSPKQITTIPKNLNQTAEKNNTSNSPVEKDENVISKQLLETIIQNRVEEEFAKLDDQNQPATQEPVTFQEIENIVENIIAKELQKRTQLGNDKPIKPAPDSERIQALLTSAVTDISRFRLTTPKGNNALEKYNEVLQLDPANSQAKQGFSIIVEKYLQLAAKSTAKQKYRSALYYLKKAKYIQPNNQSIFEAEKTLKTAFTDNKNTRTFTKNTAKLSKKIDMVWVNPGCFQMGDIEIYASEHEVCLPRGFYIGKYEVTQSQWQSIMGTNPSVFKGENKPVQNVSWNNVQTFIRKLNELTGKNYRLPTEAEWEFACRSRGKKTKYCGSNNPARVAWYKENSESKIHPVGQKQPNSLGLYDMSGNVWEWVQDYYHADYYDISPISNPKGPLDGAGHVVRGGSWFSGKGVLRSSYRVWYAPGIHVSYLGFRLAK